MPVLAAVLALALAGPGSVAPPSVTTADAIYAEIAAGDPRLTTSPAPLERLLAATELAEEMLREATDPDDVSDLLTLAVGGRKLAHLRTGEAVHLCGLITAADLVLARVSIPHGLSTAASDFRQEARDSLGAKVCGSEEHEKTVSPPPTERAPNPVAQEGPAESTAVSPPVDRSERRPLRLGLGMLVPGVLLFAPMAGLLAYRDHGEAELQAIRDAAKGRPPTRQEVLDAATLGRHYTAATAGAAAFGIAGAALVVTSVALLVKGARQRRVAVAPWGARGLGGLVLQTSF